LKKVFNGFEGLGGLNSKIRIFSPQKMDVANILVQLGEGKPAAVGLAHAQAHVKEIVKKGAVSKFAPVICPINFGGCGKATCRSLGGQSETRTGYRCTDYTTCPNMRWTQNNLTTIQQRMKDEQFNILEIRLSNITTTEEREKGKFGRSNMLRGSGGYLCGKCGQFKRGHTCKPKPLSFKHRLLRQALQQGAEEANEALAKFERTFVNMN
jgi:hypothetical protein